MKAIKYRSVLYPVVLVCTAFWMWVSCDDGLDVLEIEPPIIEILQGTDVIEKNVRDTVPIPLNVRLAASEGLASFVLTKNGEIVDSLSFDNDFSYLYEYQYTIEDGLEAGEEVLFNFKLTDMLGEVTEQLVTLKLLDRLFLIKDIELNGELLKSIQGTIDTSFTMTADTSWLVIGNLSVQAASTLKIEPGTTIYMKTYDDIGEVSNITIERDGRIEAEGTKDAPIVFTSERVLTGNAEDGDWGSFNLRGKAPVNGGVNGVILEGGPYGGQEPEHDAGIMRYVRIEYTGKNGSDAFRLQGVGSGTTLEFIQIYKCTGEGLKIAGGTFHMRYFVGTAIYDDNMEWESGFRGKGQFWVFESDTERQSEISFYGKNLQNLEPKSNPIFSNVTILGPGQDAEFEFNGSMVAFNNRGMRMTNSTHGRMYNFIVTRFNDDGVRVEQALDRGDITGPEGNLVISHTFSFNNKDNYDLDGKYFIYDPSDPTSDPSFAVYNNSQEVIPGIGIGDFVGSRSEGAIDPTTLDSWFLPASYIGAIENEENDWTSDGEWCRNLDGSIR